MATLNGQPINTSYSGLIKTTDNAVVDTGLKQLSDGQGNLIPLEVSTEKIVISNGNIGESTGTSSIVADPANQEMAYLGNHNFTAATVTGISGGGGGLVPGTGLNSMKSADDLTPNDALAGGQNAIAIGEGANANQDFSLSVGTFSQAGIFSTALGTYSESSGVYCTAVGPSSKATGDGAVSVGQSSEATGAGSVGVGREAKAIGANAISIGSGNTKITNNIIIGDANGDPYNENTIAIGLKYTTDLDFRGDSVSIGNGIYPSRNGVYIGSGANHTDGGATHAIAIGKQAVTSGQGSISLGREASSTAAGAVAIGQFVTASTVNTVTVKKLQMLDYATLNFASDAAAATGGIPLGGVYHTEGALKIRIA